MTSQGGLILIWYNWFAFVPVSGAWMVAGHGAEFVCVGDTPVRGQTLVFSL